MHVSHLLPGLLLVSLLAGGCISPADSAAPSVAVVDSARVFKESEPGKAGIKHLESLHESMQAELNALQQALQAKPNDEALQQKLQEKYMVYQQRISAEQQQVINTLNEAIQKALDACRAQLKVAIIVGTDVVLSYGPAADITAAVIGEVNKTRVEFKPIEPEAEAAAPVTQPAAPAQNATQAAPKTPAKK
ncbi:MAG: OmpH family outer membrane protein [Deltaproteobacteria bacterium]|jgi:outer membrane protein|nr:OmpH family outer membrane protein [Deltaproteobacteria bacterium]